MNDLQIAIGRYLAMEAVANRRTTYQELGRAVNWSHPTGRGLGNHLYEVLKFTHENGLPCLTSIVCKGGTRSPGDDALEHIWNEYGNFDVEAEQRRVFEYDWTSVSEFTFEFLENPTIDDARLFATRVWGFDPANSAMQGFSSETARDNILTEMEGWPIYVVNFCGQSSEQIVGRAEARTMQSGDVARVLGILELQPEKASHGTHSSEFASKMMIDDWGETRWNYGIAVSRAWEIVDKPLSIEALPITRSVTWPATNSIVQVADSDKAILKRYQLHEVPVFGQEFRPSALAFREPMHTTYLAKCTDTAVLAKTQAPEGTMLVKIGVTGDPKRRLSDLNDHHFAKIFGLRFEMFAKHRWLDQNQALGGERAALEWAEVNATAHASGEYFFMTKEQMMQAVGMVQPVKKGRTVKIW